MRQDCELPLLDTSIFAIDVSLFTYADLRIPVRKVSEDIRTLPVHEGQPSWGLPKRALPDGELGRGKGEATARDWRRSHL